MVKHVLYEGDELSVKNERGYVDTEVSWGLDNGAILVLPNHEPVTFKAYSHKSEKFGSEFITVLWQPEDGRFVDVEVTLQLRPAEFEHDHERCRAEFEDGPFEAQQGEVRFAWED